MKKVKQLLAVIGIVLLAGMYLLSLIFAITDNSKSGGMLMASLCATVFIPVFLYAMLLVYQWTHQEEEAIPKIFAQTYEINTLIFDIGNVLVRYDWQKLLRDLKFDKETADAVADAVFLNEDWTIADRGLLTEDQILRSFIENNPAYEAEIRKTFERIGDTIQLCPYTTSWLRYLEKRGYRLYFLSNYSRPLFDRSKKALKFVYKMNGGYMSWQIHHLKPEPEIYQRLLKDFDIDPSKAVFIDDCLENVAEARTQGLHAIHFRGKKHTDKELLDFGVK